MKLLMGVMFSTLCSAASFAETFKVEGSHAAWGFTIFGERGDYAFLEWDGFRDDGFRASYEEWGDSPPACDCDKFINGSETIVVEFEPGTDNAISATYTRRRPALPE